MLERDVPGYEAAAEQCRCRPPSRPRRPRQPRQRDDRSETRHAARAHRRGQVASRSAKRSANMPIMRRSRWAPRSQKAARAARTYTIGGAHCHALPPLGRADAQPPAGGHGSLRPRQREVPAASCARSTATCCNNPAEMAKACVEKYGADLISVRLEGTHPEKGNRSAGAGGRSW